MALSGDALCLLSVGSGHGGCCYLCAVNLKVDQLLDVVADRRVSEEDVSVVDCRVVKARAQRESDGADCPRLRAVVVVFVRHLDLDLVGAFGEVRSYIDGVASLLDVLLNDRRAVDGKLKRTAAVGEFAAAVVIVKTEDDIHILAMCDGNC